MKTQKIILMKVVLTNLIAAAIIIISSCGGRKDNPGKGKAQLSVSESVLKPPATDLHTAAFMGDIKAVQQHIMAGTDLNARDEYGSSPLIIAVTFNKAEVAKALVHAGADIDCANNDGSTPLHTAAFLCRIEIVEMLLDNGADKNIRNNFGSTALESIEVPFDNVKAIYDQFSKDLGPFGLKLDYDQITTTRPRIAEMLR